MEIENIKDIVEIVQNMNVLKAENDILKTKLDKANHDYNCLNKKYCSVREDISVLENTIEAQKRNNGALVDFINFACFVSGFDWWNAKEAVYEENVNILATKETESKVYCFTIPELIGSLYYKYKEYQSNLSEDMKLVNLKEND